MRGEVARSLDVRDDLALLLVQHRVPANRDDTGRLDSSPAKPKMLVLGGQGACIAFAAQAVTEYWVQYTRNVGAWAAWMHGTVASGSSGGVEHFAFLTFYRIL